MVVGAGAVVIVGTLQERMMQHVSVESPWSGHSNAEWRHCVTKTPVLFKFGADV
jgi:hypothetical protein